ncbi:hypothetical protein NQ317_011773 [Molorchus minor]|uniref:Uncharacterized protein n=1 Tax=Molorchus minor TaxID=1323400 RepID=A0ABQ9JHD3_9CUCU|nr:hypothetical protein NQ317_011773 [Molorchus minor]
MKVDNEVTWIFGKQKLGGDTSSVTYAAFFYAILDKSTIRCQAATDFSFSALPAEVVLRQRSPALRKARWAGRESGAAPRRNGLPAAAAVDASRRFADAHSLFVSDGQLCTGDVVEKCALGM